MASARGALNATTARIAVMTPQKTNPARALCMCPPLLPLLPRFPTPCLRHPRRGRYYATILTDCPWL
jgi:hypothetical protein